MPSPPPHHDGAETTRTSSYRVYYGGSSGSIPFKWESTPGTPIHSRSSTNASSSAVPPLAPPPSFHFADSSTAVWPKSKFRPNLVIYVLQKLKRSDRHVSPLYSSSSFTSSSQSGKNKINPGYFRVGRLCGAGSPLHSGGDYLDKDYGVVRTASFGDGALRFEQKKRRFGGCFGI